MPFFAQIMSKKGRFTEGPIFFWIGRKKRLNVESRKEITNNATACCSFVRYVKEW